MDLCIILANLIQNAVEELKYQTTQRLLEVEIIQGTFFTGITIKNSTQLLMDEKDKRLLTQKKDKKNHGIGLKNVKDAVERNEGKLELSADGKLFLATVTLKNKRN